MMKKYKLMIVNISIFVSLGSNLYANSQTIGKLNILPSQWHNASFYPSFYDETKLVRDYISIWSTKGSKSRTLDSILKPIPEKLKQHLFSQQTLNPFKTIYRDAYTRKAKVAFKKCDFVGIQFELDDQSDTKEWYIAAPVETCLYGEKSIGPIPAGTHSNTHLWILQKNNNDHYKVLMESEGTLKVTNLKHQGYKQLKTKIYNQHIYREKALKKRYPPLACGGAGIKWQFKEGKYHPIELSETAAFCDQDFNDLMESGYQRGMLLDKMLKEVVRPQILRWLNSFSKEPLTVEWKSRKVIPVKPDQKSRNTSTAFSADEMEMIDKLLH